MNAAERILVYNDLPPEGVFTSPGDPPPSWPDKGEIQFTDAELRYREGLPLILKKVSFTVHGGEKVS
jgi:ABC-type multidrug transport system fused ATPase/permease subunit